MVHDKIPPWILQDMTEFVQECSLKFWGEEKGVVGFTSDMVYLTTFKDMTGHGFNKLLSIFDLGYKLGNTSIERNIRLVRDSLYH